MKKICLLIVVSLLFISCSRTIADFNSEFNYSSPVGETVTAKTLLNTYENAIVLAYDVKNDDMCIKYNGKKVWISGPCDIIQN